MTDDFDIHDGVLNDYVPEEKEELTLDDIIYMGVNGDDEFSDLLDKYLSSMEHSRNSAEEILAAIESVDLIWELYDTLFTRYDEFLTVDERTELIEKYKSIFDIPIPGITD